jgi:hypothetical protein
MEVSTMTGHWAIPLRALGIATAVGCGSNAAPHPQSSSGTTAPMSDDAGATSMRGGDTNPDGIAYPSPPYGRSARSGTTPGNIISNFKFLGYPDAVVAPQPTRISLADYYDPCSKRYKIVHITVASVWCVPCNQETDAFVAAKAQLDSQGIVVVQALDDGPVLGTGATQADLDTWVASHHTNFTELLDPGLQNLAGFFAAAAVPWNCDIDPRTMEIIDATTGWAGDVKKELAPALAALPATPSYAPPAACN